MRRAKSFTMAVAFITSSGLMDLKSIFVDLAKHGVRGRLITSTYLGFNSPTVFEDLRRIPNLDVRIFEQDGFHTKAYYFDCGDFESIIIGSANLTEKALKTHFEWNLRVTSTERGDVVQDVKAELNHLWESATPLNEDWVQHYKQDWVAPKPNRAVKPVVQDGIIRPNQMQVNALEAINNLRVHEHAKRALVVAATGTGKTYLAAFDVKKFAPKRMLFIVHREQILRSAMASFKKVLGGKDDDYGILSGSERHLDCKYTFATVNMVAKERTQQQFGADAFDYIIIDEAHRVGEHASMYQSVLNYFKPEFMLGMTATPERSDGTNVYEYFDYHLAYEISLLDSLDNDLLTPFHYYGVTDYERNGEAITDTTDLKRLVADERVDYLLAKADYYGPRGDDVHGLIFVSRVAEGQQLAEKLRARGVGAIFVSGQDSVTTRMQAVRQLEKGTIKYILTVDIFNEGVDIPVLNQIVMMRPTQSAIIFLQQLGRGLRKAPRKSYVTVLDFIGNYDQNYMIPMAFDKSRTSNKEVIRKHIISPSISGVSTINFEEQARRQILRAVDKARLNDMKRFRDAYQNVKDKNGRQQPTLLDFARFGSVSVADIVKKFNTLYAMRAKFEEAPIEALTEQEQALLLFCSREIAVSKRPVEAWVLSHLLNHESMTDRAILQALDQAGIFCTQASLDSAARVLNQSYFMDQNRQKYGALPLIARHGDIWELSESFTNLLAQDASFAAYVQDTVAVCLWTLRHSTFNARQRFTIGEKYYRNDVIKMLDWEKEQNAQNVGGYMMRPDKRYLPIFIALNKTDQFKNNLAYEDEFLDRATMLWFSKSGMTSQSKREKYIIEQTRPDFVQLFVKKTDDDKQEGNDFYYLGTASVVDHQDVERPNKDGKQTKVVRFKLRLHHAVNESLYRAMTDFEELE
ncbi:DEAD/DEAH box helicase [Lacticaseibacillus pabuli]|uniref:DEAD/DEAH box helicase n=1 Tax=Lacticaseibacillus pabuli TaxID=3025672 RepID=A0ABY7WUT1_9LACO|nr:DEAD/DEAH box helicase [Lacticaseibacillus sp. KACC 23028]WDF82761.1 DEAD/DEAH box helicase [Lacticaseibacillus sp. KACC 23028]